MNSASGPTPSFFKGVRLIDPEAGIDAITDLLVTRDGVEQNPTAIPSNATQLDGTGLWAMPGGRMQGRPVRGSALLSGEIGPPSC